jgi:hypothetical protein
MATEISPLVALVLLGILYCVVALVDMAFGNNPWEEDD